MADARFNDEVKVTCSADQTLIISDIYLDHALVTGFVGTNEQLLVPAEYAAPIPSECVNLFGTS